MINRRWSPVVFTLGALCGVVATSTFLFVVFSPEQHTDGIWWLLVYRSKKNISQGRGKGNNLVLDADIINLDSTPLASPDTEESTQNRGTNRLLGYPYVEKGEEIAHQLASKVRLLCWVATMPKNYLTKAAVIRDTWGRRCDTLLFMSSANTNDSSLPVVSLNVGEGRAYLFDKTKEAMKYVYKYYLDSLDWVLKADDDTFVIVENLRYLLSKYNSSKPLYLGCRFRPFAKQGFMSGGAGYVLSREALRKLVEEGIGEDGKCLNLSTSQNGEDVLMGKCLEAVDVPAGDTRDEMGRGRFFPYSPEFHLFPDHASPVYQWYWDYQYYPDYEGLGCCSDSAVSFHYISPNQLHAMNYLLYTLHPYGTALYTRNTSTTTIRI